MAQSIIRLVLAQDNRLFREAVKFFLSAEEDFCVVGEVDEGGDMLASINDLRPDVVVICLRSPNSVRVDTTRAILSAYPSTQIVGLSLYDTQEFVVEILRAGASSILGKNSSLHDLSFAIREAVAGRVYLDSQISTLLVENLRRAKYLGTKDLLLSQLTPREREILQQLALGRSTRNIAALLHLSTKTVDTHRQNIKRKLSMDSIAALTKFAIRAQLISLED